MAADSDNPGILRLTPDTRRRIYMHTDLAYRQYYGKVAPAVYDLGDPSNFAALKTQYEINQGYQTFHGLLPSCRTIYTEASALLYSANWFIPSIGCFCRPPTHRLFIPMQMLGSADALIPRLPDSLRGRNPGLLQQKTVSLSSTVRPPTRMYHSPGDYPYGSFTASQFLRHVVPLHCLRYIRFLELVFAPFTHLSRPRDKHTALQDWSETVDWVKHQFNLPGLTLRLIMGGNGDLRPEGSGEMTRAQGKEVLATYNRILSPLRRLDATSDGGLARFYAELAWPYRWTRCVTNKLGEEDALDWLDSKDRELKRRAEQFVMGERYDDGISEEAAEPQRSVWMSACLY
ncbi:hypothetical protein VTI74DRAFT_4715 [Chaetomium olivicolor]